VWGGQTDFRRNLVAVGPFVSSTGGWTWFFPLLMYSMYMVQTKII
jgi:hypothetical protein